MEQARREQLTAIYADELTRCIAFWEQHSPDVERGGFFTLLDRAGQRYGDDKPVWLQGRAIWLFATLYCDLEPRDRWLDLARSGYRFLREHCRDAAGKLYFNVTADGQPLQMRRYVFSEVFACIAAAALYRATGEAQYWDDATDTFERFRTHLADSAPYGPKVNPAVRPMKGLSPLMCLLNMADTLQLAKPDAPYESVIDHVQAEILKDFVQTDRRCVLETVQPDGGLVPGPDGRVMNPGHVIECGWFLLEVARRRRDLSAWEAIRPLIDWPLELGWDEQYGGLLYFIDVEGRPATQLEHDMKLWWPHCEALYATLLAYELTNEPNYLKWFERIHTWTFERFPDAEHGEWFGYLHRDGSLSTPLKGGIWKGPFHVPRALLYCKQALERLGS